MDPMTMMLIAQSGLALGKSIFGGIQTGQAKKSLNNMPRPQMQIPPEAITALANSQKQSLLTQIPGYDLASNRINSGVQANTNALSEVNTGGSLLESTNRAFQQGQRQITDLELAGAQFNQANQSQYRQELGQMANLKNQQFQVNQLDPYNQRRAELNNQRDAGNQNLWGGMNSAAQAAGSYLGMSQEQSNFDKYFGNKQTLLPTGTPSMGNANTYGIPSMALNNNPWNKPLNKLPWQI